MKKTVLLLTILMFVITISKAQTIATGWNHSLAICSDSTAWAWGYNQSFTLGNGTNVSAALPLRVSLLTEVIAIDGGFNYSIALKSDGTVWSWGWNQYGELGNGIPADTNIIPVQVNVLSGITAISAVGSHSLALKNDSTVWAWGYNVNGELGNGISSDTNNIPMQIPGLSGITAIATGGHHSLALKSDSTVWAWGANGIGQLGIGTNIDSYSPVQVTGLTGVVAIVGNGETNSLALKSDGTVWAFGSNNYGQLGNGTNLASYVPIQVAGLTGITAINGGTYHSLALKNDSTVWAWGWNGYGQLGNGTIIDTNLVVQVIGLTGITAITAGSGFSLAEKSDGSRWAWGLGGYGQLGNGNSIDSNVPLRVQALCCVPINTSQSPTICNGDSVVVGNNTYTANGTYTDTLTSVISGCDSIVITQLTVNDLPAVTINLSDVDTLCQNMGVVNLSGESPVGGIYSGTGVTGNTFNTITAGLGSQIITYNYTDGNNCSNNASGSIYVDVCTGINETPNNNSFTIYPNPTSGQFKLSLPIDNAEITVTDILGLKILKTQATQKITNLQLYNNGVYIVYVKTKHKTATQKLIVNR